MRFTRLLPRFPGPDLIRLLLVCLALAAPAGSAPELPRWDDPHEAGPAVLPGRDWQPQEDFEAGPALPEGPDVPESTLPALVPWPSSTTFLPGQAVVLPTTTLREVRFRGNTVIDDETLRGALAPFLHRPLSPAELDEARFSITRLYTDRGYVNSGVAPLASPPADGVAEFEIREGALTGVIVRKNTHFRSSFFEDRMLRAGRAPLHFPTLQQQLQVFQTHPAIVRLNAELKPGSEAGEALLLIDVEDRSTWSFGIDLHNHRPPSTGAEQAELWLRTANATGVGDTLHARLGLLTGGSDDPRFSGTDNLFLRYQRPLLPDDTTLDVRVEKRDYVIVDDIFAPLDITGETWRVAAGLRRPILRRFDNERSIQDEVWLSLMLERGQSRTFLMGEPFPIAPGTRDGELDLTILRFGQDWTRRTRNSVLAVRSQFSAGLDILGATDVPSGPDETFLSWSANAQYSRRMNRRGDLLLATGGFQLADARLPSQEQLSLGGRYTVRGFRENTLVRDNGAYLGLEYRVPVTGPNEDHQWSVEAGPFVDAGIGWNSGGRKNTDLLLSAGLGVHFSHGDWLRGELYWGLPLTGHDDGSGDLQDAGLHFRCTIARF